MHDHVSRYLSKTETETFCDWGSSWLGTADAEPKYLGP
jgi:hypothetical protein